MIPQEESAVPVLLEPSRAPLQYAPTFQSSRDDEPEEGKRAFLEYIWVLKRHRWKILAFVAAVVAATAIVSERLTPIYEATATIDVDRQTPPGVVGEEAARGALNDADQFLATQMKLVESDSVLRPVDQRFALRRAEGQAAALAPGHEEAPVTLKLLRVTRPPNTYLMLISYRSADAELAADAANAIAQSYLEHTYEIRLRSAAGVSNFMERQMEELKVKMERSGQAVGAIERELNVINPEEKTNILSSRLLQLNTEFTNAQAARLKEEAAYQSVASGSMESALAALQGEELRRLTEHLNEARERFSEVQSHYGANHPEYRKAQAQLAQVQEALEDTRRQVVERVAIEYAESQRHEQMVGDAVADAKTEFDRVNLRFYDYQTLKREADADRSLYEQLVRKIEEARINAGFQSNAVKIADPARPPLKPVFPNLLLNVLLALLFSALLASGAAITGDILDKTVRDPDQVARTLHTEVIGSLPLLKNRGTGALRGLIESAAPGAEADSSGFQESVRTLRNSILLANFEHRYRSLMVTSASPGEGKTTTAANLAAVHAGQGKRTLLIDGDLRRPSVHRNFNLPSVVGLFNVLMGEIPWRDALLAVEEIPNLSILPAGPPTRRASDLMGRGVSELIEDATAEFDLVILDAPPLLGFAEPLHMATAVDGVIIVARAGQTSRKAVGSVLTTLHRLRVKVIGLVLNEVHKELSDSYYYYGYYRSYYHAQPETEPQALDKS
jgi:capsular exopolysaccharide synthesis family protein